MQQIQPRTLTPETNATLPASILFSLIAVVFGSLFLLPLAVGLTMFLPFLPVIILGSGLLLVVLIGLPIVLKKAWNNTEYVIEEDKIRKHVDFFSKQKKSVSYDKITDVTYEQSFLQSQFNVGKIQFNTAGDNDKAITFNYVENAEEIYNELEPYIKSYTQNSE